MTCFNCGTDKVITAGKDEEIRCFCTICGSEYEKFYNIVKGNSLTEIRTINNGVKVWKPKKSTLHMSFISDDESKRQFIRFCEKGVKKFELELAYYTEKVRDNLYIKHNLLTGTKSYIKCIL